ncbi:YcgL domain-containing protein [Chromohalobacter canadensis]|uniref:YcgL domain-containing protein n=1 Tax=Chromohalobacter canadensis TaxID=141389 RepID=UPI0021C0657A|nr:YcgL domain-containing protein [Chromohalobacter canadensis]MCT8467858.1 YcgL domain-containing protein [Chromohalobacter canadensis]MCT8470393.1 YcgL domain-containing protein [Chromohalobacter canadensis]MCT8498355.1 YcgL domain-containing protein [Chromohalobacter canadensis]
MSKRLCEIFKSPRRDEMYLYVDRVRGLADVPEALLERFGTPVSVAVLMLSDDKSLARARASDVLAAIASQGFYLQMPPAREDYLLDLYKAPTEARY